MTEKLGIILEDYSSRIRDLLGSHLIGVYLTGSIALGGYHDGKSDIDFTVVMKTPLSNESITLLKALHKDILSRYPRNIFEGHYITSDALGKEPDEIEPIISYYQGKVAKSYHGISIVTWFTLKKYGVTVWGLPAESLKFDAPEADLLSYTINNVNSYWKEWVRKTKNPLSLKGLYALTEASVEWGVLGISRMYFTISERDVTSKDKGIEYALKRMPLKYHKILKEAMNIRAGKTVRLYRSSIKRRHGMLEYMEYVIKVCNHLAKSPGH